MTNQHTPGPWILKINGTDQRPVINIIDPDDGRTRIATVNHSGISSKKRDANASLIAAAPELLEALKTLIAYAALNTTGDETDITAYRAAMRAVDKATNHQ